MSIENKIISLLNSDARSAIPLIYDHYADNLYGVILSILKNEDDAKEVIQESFVKYWKKANTYDASKSRLFTWLLSIARNTAIDKLRQRKRSHDREIQIDIPDVYSMTGKNWNPEVLDIRDHITSLDKKQRLVLEALYFQGMTQQEASESLDMPLGSIKTSLRLAMRELRKLFDVNTIIILILITLLS